MNDFEVENFFEAEGDAAMDTAILEHEGREQIKSAARYLFNEMCKEASGSDLYEYLLAGWIWIDDFLDSNEMVLLPEPEHHFQVGVSIGRSQMLREVIDTDREIYGQQKASPVGSGVKPVLATAGRN